jgi:hypothetical protein
MNLQLILSLPFDVEAPSAPRQLLPEKGRIMPEVGPLPR